jgi:transposase-like protein
MVEVNLTDPIFNNEDAAREHLESIRWPNGPFCPHCGESERVTRLHGKTTRAGLFQCNSCREHFTVTVGSVMERSHIPLPKWVLGFHLMAASKKGISAHQLHRMLGIQYKSAWFMAMRIREAMRELHPSENDPLGGKDQVVEVDETYVGGKARNQKGKVPPKEAVVALVEPEGRVSSHHVPEVTAKTLRPILVSHIDRKSYLMTDESLVYPTVGREFSGHGTVNHSIEEYVRTGGFHHTNTVESYFAILKRGIVGTFHHVSQYHLKRYLGEFDFRYNERVALGVEDTERATKAIKGAAGKRLTYRQPNGEVPSWPHPQA